MRWLFALLLLGACSSNDEPPKERGITRVAVDHGYPMDGVLRINHVQVKGTHNSYHLESPGNMEPTWKYSHAPLDVQLDQQGVRGLELDTRWVEKTARFEVFHLPYVDEATTCRAFVDCLSTIKRWSDAHPAHVPLFLHIEPKDLPEDAEAEDYFARFENEVLSVWPRERIVTPDDVFREAAFPTLGEARGTVLFYIDNADDWRRLYTHGGATLEGRLMFVESLPADPFAGVAVLNDPTTDRAKIDECARAGMIVRTTADGAGDSEADTAARRAAAIASPAHVLSSDFPTTFEIPNATPARCNPLTAPPGCTSDALERR